MKQPRTIEDMPGRYRTPATIRYGVSKSAATLCECGGLLAEDDRGHVFCLRCEPDRA